MYNRNCFNYKYVFSIHTLCNTLHLSSPFGMVGKLLNVTYTTDSSTNGLLRIVIIRVYDNQTRGQVGELPQWVEGDLQYKTVQHDHRGYKPGKINYHSKYFFENRH